MKTIKKNIEFQRIYQQGKKRYGNYCLLFLKEQKQTEQEFGFVVSKKVGNAVIRNRIKRIFREVVRKHSEKFPKAHFFILVAKQRTGQEIKKINFVSIEKDILTLLKKEK